MKLKTLKEQKKKVDDDSFFYDDPSDISDILLEFDSLGEHNEELSYLSQSE